MKVWAIACALVCASASQSEDCVEVSAGKVSPMTEDLNSALEAAGSVPSAWLCLSPTAAAFTVNTRVVLYSQVTVQGNAQAISFFKTLEVRGSLAVFNATLTASVTSSDFSMFTVAGGSIHIKDSAVDSISATVVAGCGSIVLEGMNFASGWSPAISIEGEGDSTVQILQCDVWNHTGQYMRVAPLVGSRSLSMTIDRTSFIENRGNGFLIAVSAPLLSGHFTVSNTEFASNEIPLIYLDIGDLRSSIVSSSFTSNSQSTLTLSAKDSVVTLEDSLWSGNSQVVFDIWQFTGDFIVTGITVTNQVWKGVFQLSNSLPAEECRFTLQDSTFLDTYFRVGEPTPGLILASGCLVLVTRALISNVQVAASDPRDLEALVMVKFGSLTVSHTTMRSSGSAGMGLGVIAGDFTVADSFLYDMRSGINLYVGTTLGRLFVHNVNITSGTGSPLTQSTIGTAAMYFASLISHLEVRNMRVLHGPFKWEDYPNSLYACFSTLDISGVFIEDLLLDAIGHFVDVQGSISNVAVHNSVIGFALFYLTCVDLVRIANVDMRNSSIMFRNSTGIFFSSPGMNIECSDFTLQNATVEYFAASKKSKLHLRNIDIADCHMSYLVKYQIDSVIVAENVHVRRSRIAVATLYRSSFLMVNSSFEDFVSASVIFEGENANMTVDRVTMKNASSPLSFSMFREQSQFTITRSKFEGFHSNADEGFYHETGSLSIADSSFRFFNTVFIQARSCFMYISNSAFQEGSSKALSSTSDSAYGGALGCTDCLSVVIEHSTFLNVSAIFGGAVAVRSSLDSYKTRISDSEFVGCSATAGGALYLGQSSCVIEGSKFIGNAAVSVGGAIDLAAPQGRDTLIRSCAFYRNSASEGGAVKWSETEVPFVNVTFQDNSATYGPDIASYGVKLSGKVASPNQTEASGYPLQLIFELQDHYGQVVVTASVQDFQLLSNDQVHFRGNTAATIYRGVFNFSQLIVYAQPNSTQTISGVMFTFQNRQISMLNASVDINFRDCVPGEVRKADRCEYCFAGNVSFSPSDSDCSFCPKHGFCTGGNVLLVDSRYWRNSTNSTAIVRCPLREHCLGGEHSDCAEGYTGQVCNECSEDFTRHRTLECERCGNHIIQWGKVLLIVAPIIGFHAAVKTATNTKLYALKAAINHAQLLSVLAYLRVSYPPIIKYTLHSLSYVSSLFITDLPISCFSSGESEYVKAVIGSAVPLFLSALFTLLNLSNMKHARALCTSAMMFTPMVSLITQLPLLTCQSVNSDGEYMFVDMRQKCWEGRHLLFIRALLLPSAILNVLLPVALISVMSIAAPQKFDDSFPLWLSGVNWRSWELMIYCAKGALMCLVIQSMVIDQLCQVAYGLLVLIIASVLASGMNKYAYTHWKWFALTESSLVIVALSIGLSANFIYHSPSGVARDWLISGVFVVVNAGFFAACVKVWRLRPVRAVERISLSTMRENPVPQNSVMELECSQNRP